MKSVPPGWEATKLREVVQLRTGPFGSSLHQTDYVESGVPIVNPMHISNGYIRATSKHCVSKETAERLCDFKLEAGDIVLGRRGEMGRCAVVRESESGWLCGTGSLAIKSHEGIQPNYLQRFLSSDVVIKYLTSESVGSTMVNLNQQILLDLDLPIPPTTEQTRIVEKLEELLSDLDAGVAELKAAQRKLAQYRQSLLKAAVEGALTADWRAARVAASSSSSLRKQGTSDSRRNTAKSLDSRVRGNDGHEESGADLLQRILTERRTRWEQKQLAKFAEQGKTPPQGWRSKYPEPIAPDTTDLPALPHGWAWANMDQLSFIVRGASPRPAGDPRYFGGSIPWITVGSLTADDEMYLDQVDLFVTEAGKDASRYIEPDTLLLTNSGATLGVPKITRIGGCINDGSVALLDIDEPAKTYLYWFLRTQTKKLRATNQGAAQPNLNTDIVRRICVPVCHHAEMIEINAVLEQQVSSLHGQEAAIAGSLKQAAAQRKNILKAAFAGQLVPQDPNDEPASVLLERIRAAKVEHAGKAKPVAKRGRKA